MATLEEHYRDLCDIEFTIERGKLWMLQTRVGKRTAGRRVRHRRPAGRRGPHRPRRGAAPGHRRAARPADVPALRRSRRDVEPLGHGHRRLAGRGRRQGRLRLRRARSSWPPTGEKVILVRRETNPDDLPGMIAAQGILTCRGGKTSHAAVVARGMGKTCVCGAEELDVDVRSGSFTVGGTDGRRGRRHLHRRHHRRGLPRRGAGRAVPGRAVLRGRASTRRRPTTRWSAAVHRIMTHADARAPAGGAGQRRHRRGRRPGPPVRRRRASACAAPSTCSSASGASWSSG